jgi:hypothetical protein
MSINSKILGLRVTGSIFGIVAVLHLLRVGFAGPGLLCAWLWLLSVSRDK